MAGEGLPASEELERFRREDAAALELLEQAHAAGGRAALERLPLGADRTQRLARARALMGIGEPEAALAILQEIVREEPRHLPARLLVGQALGGMGRMEEAVGVFEAVAQAWPQRGEARFQLALALLRTERVPEGEQVLRSLVAQGWNPGDAAGALAGHLWRQGRLEEGLAVLDQAMEGGSLHQDERGRLLRLRARSREELGDFDGARRDLRDLLALYDPADPPVDDLLDLAEVERAMGNFSGALEILDPVAEGRGPGRGLRESEKEVLVRLRQEVRRELATGRRVSYTRREILGILRSSTDRGVRLPLFRMLAGGGHREVGADLAWFLSDDDPVLRLEALGSLERLGLLEPRHVLAALEDPDPLVRSAAARRIGVLPPRDRIRALMGALRREEEPAAFRSLHETMRRETGLLVLVAVGAEEEAEGRAAAVAEWALRMGEREERSR